MLGQTFEAHDLLIVLFLVLLEGILSIDNALVLGLLARQLPRKLQRKALTYGLGGAFAFRIVAVISASYLLHWNLAKLLGGGYLIYISLRHFVFASRPDSPVRQPPNRSFWATVLVIELTDIAFAVDSIVAAIGVVGPPPPGMTRHPKTWVVMLGGLLGVLVMRLAAIIFIKLLARFPRFELAAYLLVLIIGAKLVADWLWQIDFQHVRSPAFWIFWVLMLLSFCVGFLPSRKPAVAIKAAAQSLPRRQ
jgi:YkoY family integral membrane protein